MQIKTEIREIEKHIKSLTSDKAEQIAIISRAQSLTKDEHGITYPDEKLIAALRLKYSGYGIKTMTQSEILDLINHTNEAWCDAKKCIAVLEADKAKLIEALDSLKRAFETNVRDCETWSQYQNTLRVLAEVTK